MSDSAEDRQHLATPLRRLKAAQDGDFAKSFELAIALQVLGCVMAIYLFAENVGDHVKMAAVQSWLFQPEVSLCADSVLDKFSAITWSCCVAMLPLMACCWLTVVASHWLQTGVVWLPEKVAPDGSRLSPANLWRQFFALQTLSFSLIGIPKFFLTLAIAGASCWLQSDVIFQLPWMPTDAMADAIFGVLIQLTFHIGVVLLVSSSADYWMRWISFERRIRMTDTEMREESRAQDGDPVVNSQRKQLYRA